MNTSEKIYLIDMGDEVVWCEERQPDAHIDDEDVAEYTLTSVSQAKVDALVDMLEVLVSSQTDSAILQRVNRKPLYPTYKEFKSAVELIAEHR